MNTLNLVLSNQQALMTDISEVKSNIANLKSDIGLLKKQVVQQRIAVTSNTESRLAMQTMRVNTTPELRQLIEVCIRY